MRRRFCRLGRLAALAEEPVKPSFRTPGSGLRMGGKFVVTKKAASRFPFHVIADAVEAHQREFLRKSSSAEAKARGGVTTFVTTFRWKQYGLRIVSDFATKVTTIGTVGELPVSHSRVR